MTTGFQIFAAVAALAVVAAIGIGGNPLAPLADIVDRGRRLTDCTVVGGVVQESPGDLAAQASATLGRDVTLDANSLARMCRSEAGSQGQISKVLRCHVAFNQADALGWGITQLITYHKTAARADAYGEQISGRFASGSDPYENDLAAAEYAMAERNNGIDRTFGALNFVDVGALGVQLGSRSWEETRDRWAADGKVPGTIPGSPLGLVFFWRGTVPAGAEAVS